MTQYRKDVQMLRGVAVCLVVLFHLGFGVFLSGFLGVDVFFVISGYLMGLLYDPQDTQGFYLRRAKRLLPAYFCTVVVTLLAAMLIVTPNDFVQVATQAGFATLFASNIGFWLENSYFNKAAFKPLLHLWSLGVEIQFYLLVPLVFWLFRKARTPGLVVLGVASALACFIVLTVSPKTSFFMLPFRLWEFLLGFAIARSGYNSGDASRKTWLGVVGLAVLISIPVFRVDGELREFTHGHPGAAALAVSGATALVLLFGLPTTMQRWKLATLFERIGDWSYSIYLAHFPIVVFVLYKPFSGTILAGATFTQLMLIVALVAAATAMLYRFVEMPFRHSTFKPIAIAAIAATLILLCVSGSYLLYMVAPPAERLIFEAWTDRAPYRCGKLVRVLHPYALTCEVSTVEQPVSRILLVGDSHADSIKSSFAQEATAAQASVYFVVDNTPLLPGGMPPVVLVNEATQLGVSAIVLHFSIGALSADTVHQVLLLAAARNISVSFIMPVPEWRSHVPGMLWALHRKAAPLEKQTRGEYDATVAQISIDMKKLEPAGLRVYPVADILCDNECKLTDRVGRPLYFDYHHLTLSGSALLRPVFDSVVKDIRTAEANRKRGGLPDSLRSRPLSSTS